MRCVIIDQLTLQSSFKSSMALKKAGDKMKDKFVLIDCDAGTDDALAIWMVLRAHKDPASRIQVVGVVCVNGNTSVDNVVVNVSRILNTVGESEVRFLLKLKY